MHCVVVCGKFLSLKELDGCLVQLENDNLVQEIKTFNISLTARDRVSQLCDFVNLAFLRLEESKECVFALLHFVQVFSGFITLIHLHNFPLLSLTLLLDGFLDRFKIQDLIFKPAAHH